MSQEGPGPSAAGKPAKGDRPDKAEKPGKGAAPADAGSAAEGQEQDEQAQDPGERQPAWAARRDLIDHTPETLVARDQFGVVGGHVAGDVIFQLGSPGFGTSPRTASGHIPPGRLEELEPVYRTCPSFDEALARLRDEHIVILRGSRASGRGSAALMLLHRLGARPIRLLEPGTAPAALPDSLDGAAGYLLHDLTTSRSKPLLEPHVLGMREQLARHGGLCVITVEASSVLLDVPCVTWEPPPVEDVLAAHVVHLAGAEAWQQLRRAQPVEEFIARTHQPAETRKFARQLAAHHRGELDEEKLIDFARSALADRVTRWLTEPEKPDGDELRDKAFLISLAVFDRAPYATAAELGDNLFVQLQETANPYEAPRIPIFGSSIPSRLELAHALGCTRDEATEWGPVSQYSVEFEDVDTARVLLREVWTVHPSSRPALVRWLQQLASDGRPLVRTRAAAATALLAEADLSSAMAHLIEPWASGRSYNGWLTAANALSLAGLLEVAGVQRILHTWCTGEHPSRRWTAIRVYGLLGPQHPEAALEALLDAVRLENDEEEEVNQLAEATQLLLLAVRGPVLRELVPLLHDDHTVHDHVLRAFGLACRETEEGTERPLVLQWYATALADPSSDEDDLLAALWRAALGDRAHTDGALETLQQWLRAAEHDRHVEESLAQLLSGLAAPATNQHRISYLLRTAREADGSVLGVTDRLQAAVPALS
ncbi:hypothetical protein [Streptomyces sp. MZ04]|uniref:hypothetical protein n=1 Tax=Streptomyces sp. MZ04 TaxID=2559236 RepID=UPI00107E8252|nr:hypothetical protein [Streptomyces sp. MZ04]TGB08148.1 hypothetical protein E2651_19975 [Streptomyces sp. MZ04]